MSQPRLFVPDTLVVRTSERRGWAVLETDGWIRELGPAADLGADHPDAIVIPLPGIALLPGAVNAHSHSFQSLLRGLADDRPFAEFRDHLYKLVPLLDEEGVYAGGLLAFGEMLLRGSTTVCDFFYLDHGNNDRSLAVIRAARDVGIRLVLARTMMDAPTAPAAFRASPADATARVLELAVRLQGDERCSVVPAPHSPHGASPEMIRAGARIAGELGTPWHIHVAEAPYEAKLTMERHGRGPLAWIASLGVLDERIRIVHGVWVDDAEVEMLARAGGGLIHCPGSNLFLGDGVAPLPAYLRHGVTVSLGCDSGSANSRLSIFGDMRLAAILQKGLTGTSEIVTAEQAFEMGTANGRLATGRPVGIIDVGMRADFVAVSLDDLSMQPEHRLLHNVVYSMEPTAIRHVYVGGEAVVRDGRLTRVPEGDIRRRVSATVADWAVAQTGS